MNGIDYAYEWLEETAIERRQASIDEDSALLAAFVAGYEAAQHSEERTVDQPCEKHNMEFCSECFPVVVVDFNRR